MLLWRQEALAGEGSWKEGLSFPLPPGLAVVLTGKHVFRKHVYLYNCILRWTPNLCQNTEEILHHLESLTTMLLKIALAYAKLNVFVLSVRLCPPLKNGLPE